MQVPAHKWLEEGEKRTLRVFAISDIHVDFEENLNWVVNLSANDYRNDLLILAGDVTDSISMLANVFERLQKCFLKVLYVPGNHDLWVVRDEKLNSLDKFYLIKQIAEECGISTGAAHFGPLSIVPLYGWYDYSFGLPSEDLRYQWMDYFSCKWPSSDGEESITRFFVALNQDVLDIRNQIIISFSHFLPRIDIMPDFIPPGGRMIYPVLGTSILEEQIRRLRPHIHYYGHSHFNIRVNRDDITYINNAFGYPNETRITSKELICILSL